VEHERRVCLPDALGSATYNANNQLTQRGSTSFTYDLNGNLTNDGAKTYTWKARNQAPRRKPRDQSRGTRRDSATHEEAAKEIMMLAFSFDNFLSWFVQVSAVASVGALLPKIFRTTSAVPLQIPRESVLSACRLMDPEVVIAVSANEIGPAAVGWLHRTILLPASFLSLEEEAQRAILCHEFLHILQNDWLINVFEELIEACFWFHPAVWWLLSHTRLAREQLIDSQVVRLTGAREPYLEALLRVGGGYFEAETMPAPLFFRSHLARRMFSLLDDHPVSRVRLLFSYISIAILLGLVASIAVMTFPLMALPRTQAAAAKGITVAPFLEEPQVETYGLDTSVTPPNVMAHVDPEFSDAARQSRIQGTVLLEGIVQTDGRITGVNVRRGLDRQLDRNAVYAVKQWRFSSECSLSSSARDAALNAR